MNTFSVRRAGVNVLVLGLLLCVIGGNATAAHVERSIGEILSARTEESMTRNLATALQAGAIQLRGIEASFFQPAMRHRFDRFYWGGCGGGRSLVVEPRITKLPSDPMLMLGDGYLKCRMVRAALFEPAISVASYPPGYFGEYVYEGLLVSDWIEFFDETLLRQLFAVLVETPNGPDEEMEYYEWDNEALKLAELRKGTGFFPELVIEFIGEAPLAIEINLTRGRMLIQAGDKWDFYSVDRLSAAALRTMLVAEQTKPGE